MTNNNKFRPPFIGVSIAVYNSCNQTRKCLYYLSKSIDVILHITVIDSGSTDDTTDMIVKEFPQVTIINKNCDLWWTGATNIGIRECLKAGCESVVLLNPDVIVESNTIAELAYNSKQLNNAIVSPVVLNFDNPKLVWEAGHRWERAFKYLPFFWVSRYLYKHNTPLSKIPKQPYSTDSVVGRGGLVPRDAFNVLGLLNEKQLPHYGADADMALRAKSANYPMYIIPSAIVRLHTKNTGRQEQQSLKGALKQYWQYLTSRKQGEALKVLYYWNKNNMPKHIAIPNYFFLLALNTMRYWQHFFKTRSTKTNRQ